MYKTRSNGSGQPSRKSTSKGVHAPTPVSSVSTSPSHCSASARGMSAEEAEGLAVSCVPDLLSDRRSTVSLHHPYTSVGLTHAHPAPRPARVLPESVKTPPKPRLIASFVVPALGSGEEDEGAQESACSPTLSGTPGREARLDRSEKRDQPGPVLAHRTNAAPRLRLALKRNEGARSPGARHTSGIRHHPLARSVRLHQPEGVAPPQAIFAPSGDHIAQLFSPSGPSLVSRRKWDPSERIV
jgi:hypothetical protein